MAFKIKIKRLIVNFWFVNIAGWLLYIIPNIPILYLRQNLSFNFVIAMLDGVLNGFILSILLRYYYKKIRIAEKKVLIIVIITFISCFLGGTIWYVLDSITAWIIHNRENVFKEDSLVLVLYYIIWYAIILLTWTAIYVAINIWRKWLAERTRNTELEKLAIEAKLNALRYQLNPHFLFNTLSTVRVMISKDPLIAKEIISKISDFLRYSLTENNNKKVPLKEELETSLNYLDIEKIRFGNNLVVEYNIDPAAEEYPVPAFLLNPLIDNAIKHGYNSKDEVLKIKISAEVINNKSLLIDISNSGHWKENNTTVKGTQTGLRNIKERLEYYYGENAEFIIMKEKDFVNVRILIKPNNIDEKDKSSNN